MQHYCDDVCSLYKYDSNTINQARADILKYQHGEVTNSEFSAWYKFIGNDYDLAERNRVLRNMLHRKPMTLSVLLENLDKVKWTNKQPSIFKNIIVDARFAIHRGNDYALVCKTKSGS